MSTLRYISISLVISLGLCLPIHGQSVTIPTSVSTQCVTEIGYIQTCHSRNTIVFTMNQLIKKLFLAYESASTSTTQLKTSVNSFISRIKQVKQVLMNRNKRNGSTQFVIEYLEYMCLLYLEIVNDRNLIQQNASTLFSLSMDQEALQDSELQLISVSLYDQKPVPKLGDATLIINLKVSNTTSRQINSIQSIDCVTGTSTSGTALALEVPPFTLRENRITNIIPTVSVSSYLQNSGDKSITCSIDRVDISGIRQRTAFQTLTFKL